MTILNLFLNSYKFLNLDPEPWAVRYLTTDDISAPVVVPHGGVISVPPAGIKLQASPTREPAEPHGAGVKISYLVMRRHRHAEAALKQIEDMLEEHDVGDDLVIIGSSVTSEVYQDRVRELLYTPVLQPVAVRAHDMPGTMPTPSGRHFQLTSFQIQEQVDDCVV
jgi:hypothetical protein